MAANNRPPISKAAASDVAAPAAYAVSKSAVEALAPLIAAPVKIRPRIGPAQGAHNRPVATPNNNDAPMLPSVSLAWSDRRLPSATSGRVM